MPSLLALPEGIRERIWPMVLLESHPNTQVLAVSKQMYRETQKYIYQRPLVFPTQQELFQWLERVGSRNLQHVDALSFHLSPSLSGDDELSRSWDCEIPNLQPESDG